MSDIQWIKQALVDNKQDHKALLDEVKKTNGTVTDHGIKIAELKQKQRDHFYFHKYKMNLGRHVDRMSRTKGIIIIAIIQIIAMIIIAKI